MTFTDTRKGKVVPERLAGTLTRRVNVTQLPYGRVSDSGEVEGASGS
jgi:hypothetical protein